MMKMDADPFCYKIDSPFSLYIFGSLFANFQDSIDDLTALNLQIGVKRILKNLYWHAYISPLFDRVILTS
jgi:hypothetical protein